MRLPRIAIATGDPAGIGPEIALKAALDARVTAACRPLLVGDAAVVEMHAKAARLSPRLRVIAQVGDADWSDGAVNLLDAGEGANAPVKFGTVDAAYGRASLASARRAIQAALAGDVDAVVAAPQTERSIAAAGIAFDGYPSFVRAKPAPPSTTLSDDLLRRNAHRARDAACQRARGARADHARACRAVIRVTDTALKKLGCCRAFS